MTNTVNPHHDLFTGNCSSARVNAVLAEEAGTEASGTLPAPAGSTIQFEHVNFWFSQSRPILDDINLTVPSGQWLGIIGSTGSGKTTLIASLLTRLYEHYQEKSRSVAPISNKSPYRLWYKITVALRDSLLFSGTVAHNQVMARRKAYADTISQRRCYRWGN